ncbi:PQQ-binding-like beta-propeller repeat protein [Streptomycetaceae bacterium NBC_01309]
MPLPPGRAELVAELLAKDPRHRPASAHEVHRRLRALSLDESPAPPGSPSAPPDRTQVSGRGAGAATTVNSLEAPATWPIEAPGPAGPVTGGGDSAWDEFAPQDPDSGPDPGRRRGLSRRSAVLLALGAATAAGTAIATYPWGAGAADDSAPPKKWEFATDGDISVAPVPDGGMVYVASNDGNLYAVDAASGARRWVHRTGGDLMSRPTTSNGIAYVLSGRIADDSAPDALHAVDAASGTPLWSRPVALYGGSPAVVDGVCYVGGGAELPTAGRTGYVGRFHAFDARTGEERWTFDAAAGGFYARPTVVDGVAYIGCVDGNVYAIDTATGRQRWAFRTGGAVHAAVVVADATVYAASQDTNVYAIDAATGEQRWDYNTGGPADSPAVEGGLLVVGSEENVHAINRTTGTRRWTFAAEDAVGSPTLANGLVLIGCHDGRLYGINVGIGNKSWTFKTRDAVIAAPAVTRDTIYVTSRDKRLYALDLNTNYRAIGRSRA